MLPTRHDTSLLTQYLESRSPALREQLVLNHVSLVHHVLGRLGLSLEIGTGYEDLVNQGLLGLIEAVDRFDPSFGTQFSTYATVRVRGKVLDYLRSLDWLSRTARHRTRAVQQAITTLYSQSHTAPSDEEIAAYLGLDVPKVQQAIADSSRVILSLDTLADYDPENDNSLYETLADENQTDPSDAIAENDLRRRMVNALKELPEREQMVLSLYYYEEMTLKEIGMVLGISESRVCQLHARAVLSLKALLSSDEADNVPLASPSGRPKPDRPDDPSPLPVSQSFRAVKSSFESPPKSGRVIHV